MSSKDKSIKLLFTGLDNAGKTSIILALSGHFSRIGVLRPTKGIERKTFTFLGMEIGEWDLGGQVSFRERYIRSNKSEMIFGGTEIIIFVIDIQQADRVSEAVDYLNEIISKLKSLNITPSIYVFFHKFDPVDMIGDRSEITNLSLELRNEIKVIDYPNFDFYRTSVFDVHTIIHSMSKILLKKYPKSKLIEKEILEFAKELKFEALELIDDNSLIVGSYYRSKYIEQLMNSLTPYFLEVNGIFERAGIEDPVDEEPDDQMVIQRFRKNFFLKKFELKRGGSNFYLLSCKRDSDFVKEDFDNFVTLIRETLRIS